jgi:L-glyceraldehyde 3-phosphate reductase
MTYTADNNRYDNMKYNRCGNSGLKLSAISLGLWHNFGFGDDFEHCRKMIRRAFDLGITHFDLANNYGQPYGSAEETFGKIVEKDFKSYRDELIISTKAGWDMWPGPYGNFGSRKYLIASLDQSLKRMGLEYVDIFYHHRPDPETKPEETMYTLDQIVRSGKALYVGVSQYGPELTRQAYEILYKLGTPFIIHQPNYNMFDRWIENGLLNTLSELKLGAIVFLPLAQGLLTNRYLNNIPSDSRALKDGRFLKPSDITDAKLNKLRRLNEIAMGRNQSLAQLSLAWVLRQQTVTSALIGASKVEQIEDAVGALNNLSLSYDECSLIDNIIAT